MSVFDSIKNVAKDAAQAAQCFFAPLTPKPISECKRPESKEPCVTTNLGKDVDKIISKSPNFIKEIKKLQADGWRFEYGEAGLGSYINKTAKLIVVDSNEKNSAKTVVTTMAHEVGHAGYKNQYTPPKGLTKEQFVDANVRDNLDDEGEATLTNIAIKRDLQKNCGPKIEIAGVNAKEYEKIYDKYPDPSDRKKARQEIGDIFASKEHPSTDPSKTYREYYAKFYEDYYVKNVGP